MTTTRAQLAVELLDGRQLGFWLNLVGLDSVTRDGTNRTLNAAIRTAMRRAGYGVADPLFLADDDLTPVATSDVERILDVATEVVLGAIRTTWHRAAEVKRLEPKALDESRRSLELVYADVRERNHTAYGDDLGGLSAGSIDLGFLRGRDCGEFG